MPILIILLAQGAKPVYAGAPYPPEEVSPGPDAWAETNPPKLCARVPNDPDGNQMYIMTGKLEPWILTTSSRGHLRDEE